jgi:heme-degrading monooxygenase HmoA
VPRVILKVEVVLEIATLEIDPKFDTQFHASYLSALPLIASAPGFASIDLMRCVESPNRYVLLVLWRELNDHAAFRASDSFVGWSKHLSAHFVGAVKVEHYRGILGAASLGFDQAF